MLLCSCLDVIVWLLRIAECFFSHVAILLQKHSSRIFCVLLCSCSGVIMLQVLLNLLCGCKTKCFVCVCVSGCVS